MPPRVFLSYARDDDEPFVHRLHGSLVKAGFTVWYDRASLLSRGLTFHQEIRDAIRSEVDRIVFVGGPKAAHSAFCREEWQLGLEFDHIVVTPILRLGSYDTSLPGELGLLHCEDFRDDAKYHCALAKLVASLSRPDPKLGALYGVPSLPAHFLARPKLMEKVRDALLVDLQTPQVIASADARVGMLGMGGIGKSVLAAALARTREVRQAYPDGVAWISFGQQLTRDDLLSRLRDLVGHLGGDTAFDSLPQGQGILRELLHSKAVLLVLDDVWSASDAKEFDHLGPRCRMLVTTRDAGILYTLGGELVPVSLFTEVEALQLLADAAGLPPAELPPEARAVADECGLLPLALALSAGMAKKRAGDFGSVLERLRRADLEKIADRESINPQHQSIWRAMQASVEMLNAEEQRRFSELAVFPADEAVPEAAVATLWAHIGGLDDLDTEELLINLAERSLIQLDMRKGNDGRMQRRISLHDLLHNYAMRSAGDNKTLHQSLLDAYWKRCPDVWADGPDDGWFLQHLLLHFAGAGRLDDCAEVLLDLRWLERKVQAGLTFDLAQDFTATVDALPPEHPERQRLHLLDEAVRRDVHFVARHAADYPQGLFQCLWNSAWWYDCPEAEYHYLVPEGGWKEPPPWNRPTPAGKSSALLEQWCRRLLGLASRNRFEGEGLSSLLERWRQERVHPHPRSPWLRTLRPPFDYLGAGQLAVLRGHENWVNAVAFSPDGRRVLSGSGDPFSKPDNTLRIWDVESGRELAVLRGPKDIVSSVAFSPDGRRVLSGGGRFDTTVWLWDAESGKELTALRGHKWPVNSVAFSPDGRQLLSGSSDKTVRLWDAESGRELAVLRGHADIVTSVAFSPDGRRVLSGSQDQTLRLWDAVSGRELAALRGHEKAVTCVAFSPDGRRLVSGGSDRMVRLWEAESGRESTVLRGHEDYVASVAVSPDGRQVLSGSQRMVRLWDADRASILAELRGHENWVTSVAFSPDGRQVLSGSRDKTVRLWDVESGRERTVLRGHGIGVEDVAFSPDGRRLLTSGSFEKTVRIWDTESGRELAVLRGHENSVFSVVFSPDGRQVLSGSRDKTVRLWDVGSGRERTVLRGHENSVLSVAFSPDGRQVLSVSSDKTVRLWDVGSGRELAVLRGHADNVTSVAFSPDGRRVLSGSHDQTIRLWDAGGGRELAVLRGHEYSVFSVSFSPDGRQVLSGSRDKTVRLWDVESGRERAVLRGHEDAVTKATFSADGRRVFSTSWDETVRVWDLESGECLEVLHGSGDIRAIAAGASVFPWRAMARNGETIIEPAAGGPPMARFPHALERLATHPNERVWAGVTGSHLVLLRLEGGDEPRRNRSAKSGKWQGL